MDNKQIYVDIAALRACETKIENKNQELLDMLHEIRDMINSLEGTFESDDARDIRANITNMEGIFQSYYNLVGNFATFLRNTANDFEAMQLGNKKNVDQQTSVGSANDAQLPRT